MLAATKITIVRDAMNTAADAMYRNLPEQHMLRMSAALIDSMAQADILAAKIKQEEQRGPTARFINLSAEWVDKVQEVNDLHQSIQRQMRVIKGEVRQCA